MTYASYKEETLRAEIVQVGQLMYQKSLVIGRDGNISARLDENHILTTPSGLCKGMMSPEELVIIDLAGRRVDKLTSANTHLRPTSEISMHLEAYKQRPDIQAVVHAHPPYAITLSIADISLTDCMLPEAILFLGLIQTTPYATPSSPENAAAIREVIHRHDAIVLQRHGSLVVGNSPLDAFYKTETLEQIARITYMLQPLGGGQPLPPHQVEKILTQRQALGYTLEGEADIFCQVCGVCHPQNQHCTLNKSTAPTPVFDEDLVTLITQQVMQKLKND